MVPKVLVASQTKVIEAVVDEAGRAVPGTPVVSVEPTDPEVDVWHLAALLTSPVATRTARAGGSRNRTLPTRSASRPGCSVRCPSR